MSQASFRRTARLSWMACWENEKANRTPARVMFLWELASRRMKTQEIDVFNADTESEKRGRERGYVRISHLTSRSDLLSPTRCRVILYLPNLQDSWLIAFVDSLQQIDIITDIVEFLQSA